LPGFRADPSQLYLIARVTSAVIGALTTVAAFGLGAAVHSRRVGFIAASLTAVSYLLVRDSHFGVNDALVTLLVTVGLVFCLRIARDGIRTDYLSAGALVGLAFAAKYHGIALLVPLVLAHLLRHGPRRRGDLALSLVTCALAGTIAFPSLVTETRRVVEDVYLHLYVGASTGYDGLEPSGGYAFYARALAIGLGGPLVLAALAGFVASLTLWRREPTRLVLASLPLVLIAALGAQQLYFARFVLPAVPALLVEAALALDALFAIQPALGLAAGVMTIVPPLVDSVRFDVLLTRQDTRGLARTWVADHLPAGTSVAVDAPPLGPRLASQTPRVVEANDWSLFDLSPAEYRTRAIDYLVASTFTSDVRLVNPERDARRRAFYAALPAEASVVAEFRPFAGSASPPFIYDQIYAPFASLDQLERPGPTVTVYRLGAGPRRPP
jgi:4-amino-4-deoxy-L-arabinose transferase-like glycosyltransferase